MKKARKIKNKYSIKRQKSVTLSKIKTQNSKSIKETNRKRFAMIEDKEGYACVVVNGKKLKLDKDRLKDIQNEVCIINIYINC